MVLTLAVLCPASSSSVRTGPLVADRTGSDLWYFDQQDHLNRLDLDTGQHRASEIDGYFSLQAMSTRVVVFRGDAGADVIDRRFNIDLRGASPGVTPLAASESDDLWALDDTVAGGERVWRRYTPPYYQPDTEMISPQLGQPVMRAGDRLVLQSDGGTDGTLRLLDVDRATTVELGTGCAMAANAAAIVVRRPCTADAAVWVKNLELRTDWVSLPVSYRSDDYRLSPSGKLVAVAVGPPSQRQLQVFDTSTGRVVATGIPDALEWTWTRDSRYVIVATVSALIAWRIRDGNRTQLPVDHQVRFTITQ